MHQLEHILFDKIAYNLTFVNSSFGMLFSYMCNTTDLTAGYVDSVSSLLSSDPPIVGGSDSTYMIYMTCICVCQK